MSYVNNYYKAGVNATTLYKVVAIEKDTYVIGNTVRNKTSDTELYIARIDSTGKMLWERSFAQFRGGANGNDYWNTLHIEDLIALDTKELAALAYNLNEVFILRLNVEDGSFNGLRKIYDKSGTPAPYGKLGIKARMHNVGDRTAIISIHEIHSTTADEIKQNDYLFMRFAFDRGNPLFARKIDGKGFMLTIREEEMRDKVLHLFGGYADVAGKESDRGCIITLDENLTIQKSHFLLYEGDSGLGSDNIDIFWSSPVYEETYMVMGSYHRFRPATSYNLPIKRWKLNISERPIKFFPVKFPILIEWLPVEVQVEERYTHYFVAEVRRDNGAVIQSAQIDLDFSDAGDKTVHTNSDGRFLSLDRSFFKLKPDLLSQEWAKELKLSTETYGFAPHRSIRSDRFYAFLDADGQTRNDTAFFLAETPLTYQTCQTKPLDAHLKLVRLPLLLKDTELQTIEAKWNPYESPEFLRALENLETERLCAWSEGTLPTGPDSRLQSQHLYVQAVGSTGVDSTAGIHVRWQFKKELLQHLPKGPYYSGTPSGLNQPDDYVQVLRAPYQVVESVVDFSRPPASVNDPSRQWTYAINGKVIYITFRNTTKYTQVRATINPASNPLGFIQTYGDNLMEISCNSDEFFSFRYVPSNQTGSIRTEVLSVESHGQQSPQTTVFRKRLSSTGLTQQYFVENARSLRFQPAGVYTRSVVLEFYMDFINLANTTGLWQVLGDYSLTLDDAEVYRRLEPNPGARPVHAAWPRYNSGEFVNTANYRTKWNGTLPDPRNRIKNAVEQYITRSNDPNNPQANETYYLNDVEPAPGEPDTGMTVSHLTLLQMAAMDFHVARMLGLGLSDLSSEVYGGARFVYAVVYAVQASLPGGGSDMVAMSLPTSINDKRPPVPVDLKEALPGIYTTTGEAGVLSPLTGPDGYTADGKIRYISLFNKELVPNEPTNIGFYWSTQEFNLSDMTFPVFAGLKYKTSPGAAWQLPELSHDPDYRNVNNQGNLSAFETVSIPVPDYGHPLFIHKITRSGQQIYGSYGIDWFSRGILSTVTKTQETKIKPVNELLPPSSCNALLIEKEAPLLLTSEKEQEMRSAMTTDDKTFVRLLFEYDSAQDMVSYLSAVNGVVSPDFDPLPVNEEIFANEIEVFFKPELPRQFFGTIVSVSNLPNNPLIAVLTTGPMDLSSAGQTLYPQIPTAEIPHYIGGIVKSGTDEFIIHQIVPNTANPLLPVIHVVKKQSVNPFGLPAGTLYDPTDYILPQAGSSFMVIENMLNEISWGGTNPHSFKIDVGSMWNVYEEEVEIMAGEGNDTTLNRYFRRFRGFRHAQVKISKYQDEFMPSFEGMYRLVFEGMPLAHHPQYTAAIGQSSVDWYGGSVRIPYQDNPEGERKVLKIMKLEQVGTGSDLVVYALDETYVEDPLQTVATRTTWANLYPGYRCYLYANQGVRLTEADIYPADENVLDKYSIFGFRARISGDADYISDISVPTMMFARRHDEPETPEQPAGGIFATKPDFYGRSTFTFTTKYTHKPFALSFVRTNDDLMLSSLYKQTPYGQPVEKASVEDIRRNNDDNHYNDRLLDLANGRVDAAYLFPEYDGYRFPIPNNAQFYHGINQFIDEHNAHYNDHVPHVEVDMVDRMDCVVIPEVPGRNAALRFIDFVRQTINNSYVPLTELPIIYHYIKDGDYQPHPGLQVVRDRNGVLLQPDDPAFDMAPMVKILDTNPHKTQFTDFTLDGNTTAVYFYAVREVNTQMQQGSLSPAIGPVRMVNSYAVYAPELVRIVPTLENTALNVQPSVAITINAYDAIRNIRKLKLFRTLEAAKASDIRTMELIKTIDLQTEGIADSTTWTIMDTFEDLDEIPFNDPLFYRVLVEAEIQYAEANYSYDDSNPNNTFDIVTGYAPSEPSKLIVTTIVENVAPPAPTLTYTAQQQGANLLTNVVLHWEKQAYNANYYLYKMNTQGNWVQIAKISSNEQQLQLPLADTDLNSGQLTIKDSQGATTYHHFKMLTENTASMFSVEEIVLTIPQS